MIGCKEFMVPTIFSLSKEGMRPGQMTITNDDEKEKDINRIDLSSYILLYIDSLQNSSVEVFTSFNTLFIH